MGQTLRIAMLNCDIPVPAVRIKYPTYGSIFHQLLADAAVRIAPWVVITSQEYDVVQGHYPEDPAAFDLLLVTGSASSAYDKVEWTKKLEQFLWDIYHTHSRVKIFGSCFGHQIVCQSLLRPYGVKVEQDPKGWEIGVHQVTIDEAFRAALQSKSTRGLPTPEPDGAPSPLSKPVPSTLRLQFVHADSVMLPAAGLPEGWINLGASEQCAVQGVMQPGRVLTYQGHFEFDRFVNHETVKHFGIAWDRKLLDKSLQAVDGDDDALEAAELVLRFLFDRTGDCGLATPPGY